VGSELAIQLLERKERKGAIGGLNRPISKQLKKAEEANLYVSATKR
jgi:hypothetical protein